MNVRYLLVGQAPARYRSGGPLEGHIAKKIADLARITIKQYKDRTDRINILDDYPGKRGGKGDAFPIREARSAALRKVYLLSDRSVVFVGKTTARAFGVSADQYLAWERSDILNCRFAILPHLSGIVRWWNDEDNKRAASDFLREVLGDKYE